MKLLNCFLCNDIQLLTQELRTCKCGKSRGRYLEDNLTAEIEGYCRCLAILNQEYEQTLKSALMVGTVIHCIIVSNKDPAVKWIPPYELSDSTEKKDGGAHPAYNT